MIAAQTKRKTFAAIAKPTEETFFMDHPGNPSTAANHDVPLPESVSEPSQGYGKRPTLNRPMVTDPEVDVVKKSIEKVWFLCIRSLL